MKQTLPTFFLTIKLNKSLQFFFVLALYAFSATAANAQNFYPNWAGSGNPLILNFTFPDGTTGTVRRINTPCAASITPDTLAVDSRVWSPPFNYPSTYYSPLPPNPAEYLNTQIDRDGSVAGCNAANDVVATFIINFSDTVSNIRFHVYHIDNATLRFFDAADDPVGVVRVDGNPQFEVTGNAVNSTPVNFDGSGCAGPGTNAFIGCGTIYVLGKYNQLRLSATELSGTVGATSVDNTFFTMSLYADYGDAPASYDNNGINEASHNLIGGDLRLGASVDADASEKSTFSALGDDNSQGDDENGVIDLPLYIPGGGQICTGTLGSYMTQPNEHCAIVRVVNSGTAAQLVGWLDAADDGTFNNTADRSDPIDDPDVDDGTFSTRNIPAGVTRNVILVWQNLPSTLPTNTYLRFRVTRDPAFINIPTPLGEMIDGEVEDTRALVPTAANVSISGRVVTAAGVGIKGAYVILTDSEGNARTAFTSAFGYYVLEDVPVGETYILAVSSKRYQFEPRVISVHDEITELNFIAME